MPIQNTSLKTNCCLNFVCIGMVVHKKYHHFFSSKVLIFIFLFYTIVLLFKASLDTHSEPLMFMPPARYQKLFFRARQCHMQYPQTSRLQLLSMIHARTNFWILIVSIYCTRVPSWPVLFILTCSFHWALKSRLSLAQKQSLNRTLVNCKTVITQKSSFIMFISSLLVYLPLK